MTFTDQHSVNCRCEWGPAGLTALAPADVVIVVDVLSFSTCLNIAVERGALVLPYPWKGTSAHEYALEKRAELAGSRGHARYSLSPASFLSAEPGLRCVLPSPNGAALALQAAESAAIVLGGCLRNAEAVARVAASLGSTFNVCPAGERWPDDTLRPAIEDWLGAGAVLRSLPGVKSSEARIAIAAFETALPRLRDVVSASSSGRELMERGFAADVEIASQYNVSGAVPRLVDGAFAAAGAV
jgi:2-phosphosulfolactate phosphatase